MLEKQTKKILGKERPIGAIISFVLLIISGIFSAWTTIPIIIHFNIRALFTLLYAVAFTAMFIISALLVFKVDNLETGTFIALGAGLIITIFSLSSSNIGLDLLLRGIIPIIAGAIGFRTQKETRRKIWQKRIKDFWFEFSHNKIGLVGLAILSLFLIVAIFQDPIASLSYPDPDTQFLAEQYAKPSWFGIIDPAARDLPPTLNYTLNMNIENVSHPENVTLTLEDDIWLIDYNRTDQQKIVITLSQTFEYNYKPSTKFAFEFTWAAVPHNARYSLEINITTPEGKTWPLWDQHWWRFKESYCYEPNYSPPPTYYPGRWNVGTAPYIQGYGYDSYWEYKEKPWSKDVIYRPAYNLYDAYYGGQIPLWNGSVSTEVVRWSSDQIYMAVRLGYRLWEAKKLVNDLFSQKGTYKMQMYVTIMPTSPDGSCHLEVSNIKLKVPGLVWGLMGTNHWGQDCWTRLVYGARTSLAVGLAAAFISTAIGVFVGIVAGYVGGTVDEILMRAVDILLCIPTLPLLMILVTLFGRNILYIVLIIAIFGWLGLSRLIRSQVLSIREAPFIECARASGGSSSYIMVKHLLPNVLPVALADFILSVPGAILLEAALSFIGFGDPRTPTWGREYSLMQSEGGGVWIPGQGLVWWWFLPPGIAITLLCVAFVFLGHAVDEIVNPRLRRRR
ncbi:MAG: ABC transporter permease [Candidatus Bathyarchaeia archaeon]